MTVTFTMTAREIADCSDDELQRIVRISRAPINGTRFATQRELALAEMGKRVARFLAREARERSRRIGCCVQEDFLDR
jgi:hypothetical protein